MSLEHHPSRDPASASDYWHGLIDERAAADFLDLSVRTLQKQRQTGGGPPYYALSPRCIRYTRIGLKAHAEARARTSTSGTGEAA
jgi:hypothetical protein